MAKEPKKQEKKKMPAGEDRKVNPWIPIAVVGFIVALIAVMAVMSGSADNTATTDQATTGTGTTQSGSETGTGETVDTSWITLDTTAQQISEETGIPAKMLQQFLGINEADMAKPFSQLGGEETVANAQSLVAQFGGGGMGDGSTGAPSGMGTTSP